MMVVSLVGSSKIKLKTEVLSDNRSERSKMEQKLERTPVIFDINKLIVGHDHAPYKINYLVYYSEENEEKLNNLSEESFNEKYGNKVVKHSKICFAYVKDACSEYKKKFAITPNRLRIKYRFDAHSVEKLHLTKKEIKRWVTLCKKNKLLPKIVSKNYIESGIIDLSLTDIDTNFLYIYLCASRYPQEEPFIIKGLLHMVKDLKMGFFTALGVVHYYCGTNTGHSILPYSRLYSFVTSNSNPNNAKNFDLTSVVKFVKFLKSETNNENCYVKSDSFSLHFKINCVKLENQKSNKFVVPIANLNDKHIEQIIRNGKIDSFKNESLIADKLK